MKSDRTRLFPPSSPPLFPPSSPHADCAVGPAATADHRRERRAGSSVTLTRRPPRGVDRSRLHNWLRKNLAFQAAFNAGRKNLRQVIAHRLERLANDATECVGKAVREGDAKAAWRSSSGWTFAPCYLGSDDPAQAGGR